MKKLMFYFLLMIFGLVTLTLFLGIRSIPAGSVGVITRFGKVTGRILEPGINTVIPFADSVVKYNTKKVIYETTTEDKQKGSDADYKDYPVDTNTLDGQVLNVFYTIRFSIDPTMATFVTQNIGSEKSLVEKIVKTESRIWVRNIPREFKAEDLYTGTGVVEMQHRIEEQLRPTFSQNGLILDSVGIREIQFTDAYIHAIEEKQIQFVKVETEKNIADQEKYKKDARITQAEGQAREQELQRTTISDELLEKLWIEKWDGKLPTYMMGDGTPLIQLPN